MKRILNICFALFIIFLVQKTSLSQIPTYDLKVKNIIRVAPDSLTFEVYIVHTNPGTDFQYAAAQYFFRFNPNIANGGTLKYRRIATGLPAGLFPISPTVTGNELRLASNNIPSQKNAPLITDTLPGILVVRMSLRTTANTFTPGESFGLRWRNADDPPFYTKVSAFIGTFVEEITTPQTHSIDSGASFINQISNEIPTAYRIFQNYPNPFNPSTTIKFDIAKNSNVKLVVFDLTGKEIETLVSEKVAPGSYEYKWNAGNYSSGIYFYRLKTENFTETKRMLLIK